ncbi:hypothetical protein RA26_01755 [Leisingera sp. ANG-M7]|nr:hypothetical protein RA26_01755 [Leisingera sp. ANG-M7]
MVFTDGSCRGNPGPGGWAFVLTDPDGMTSERSGHDPDTTNIKMEMDAVIHALQAVPEGAAVHIFTDSQYTINGATNWAPNTWMKNGWKGAKNKPVKNQDRWQQIMALMETRQVTFEHVKGHSGNPGNERADTLAQAASYGESAAQ